MPNLQQVFNAFLVIHVTGGTLGLLIGTYIMFAKKGDRAHTRVGKVFAISMLGAGLSSLILAALHHNDFLFAVGIYTLFTTITGWRYLYLRNIQEGQKAMPIDWIVTILIVSFCLVLMELGVHAMITGQYIGIVCLLLGLRGITLAIQDYKTYKGKIKIKNYWMVFHFQRMIGAYIAALTAFLVVNARDSYGIIPWLLPAAIIVPFIIRWSRQYIIPVEKTAIE